MQDPSQHSVHERWSELSTVSNLDTGSTYPIDGARDGGIIIQEVKSFSPTSLLVESLIEQLCKLLDKDPVNQKNLYLVICQKLHKMKLIEETYRVQEVEFMRSHYQKALLQLLKVAKSTIIQGSDSKNVLLPFSSASLDLATSFIQQESLLDSQWSRYFTDYEELEYIAKGGFGEVYKARNKLDGGEYAIKKIYLRYRNVSSFLRNLREVKLLAKLNHPNIVSYKAAWLEPLDPVSPQGQNMFSRRNGAKQISAVLHLNSQTMLNPLESEEDSGGIVFKDSRTGEKSRHAFVVGNESANSITADMSRGSSSALNNTVEKVSVDFFSSASASIANKSKLQVSVVSEATSTRDMNNLHSSESSVTPCSTSKEKAVCRFRWKEELPYLNYNHIQHEWATLYIQMQLCKCTLRQWLDERNSYMPTSAVDMKQSIEIFKQIVSGVEYIHLQGIVHHDIKPSNIFVNGDVNHVQVGDFGLACFLQHSTEDVTLMSQTSCPVDHKGVIGTKLYAAPEQLNGKCDPKSDIYSLGIVLFELIQPFSTDMERSKVIALLKANKPPPELNNASPQLVQLIDRLISPISSNRPTAQILLASLNSLWKVVPDETPGDDCAIDSNETIRHLLAVISERDHEIEELKRKVQALEACK